MNLNTWKVAQDPVKLGNVLVTTTGWPKRGHHIVAQTFAPTLGEAERYAELVSAAPDMLEALKRIRENYADAWFKRQGIDIDKLLYKAGEE